MPLVLDCYIKVTLNEDFSFDFQLFENKIMLVLGLLKHSSIVKTVHPHIGK